MTWSFDDSALASSKKDQVRLMIGDTDTTDQLVSNEAIVFYLSERGDSVSLAAADCCDIIAAKFSREVDTKNGALSVSASQRAAAYRKLSEDLRAQGAELCDVFFGGQSIDGKIDLETDTDAIQPRFARGMNDVMPEVDYLYPRRWNRTDA
jgi:hypothetical protein